jgi:hypothetical protein
MGPIHRGHRCRRRPGFKVRKAPAATSVHHIVHPSSRTQHFSYSASRYSYSKRSSIVIRPRGKQVTANRLNRRSASPQFKQPSSTSTVSLSTVSLSTSTTKSDAIHDPGDDPSKMGFGPHAMRRDSSLQPRFAAGLVRSVFRLAGKYARSSALASG